MSERVYIHEFIDIIGHQRARYMHHMTANWGPIGRAERQQLCFGVWGVIGSTGRWPQVVNLWEYEGWDALAANFEFEVNAPGLQDPSLGEWWATAADLRSGGVDRLLIAPQWSPSVTELCGSSVIRAGYVHDHLRCIPGSATEVLDAIGHFLVPLMQGAGLSLVGAFRRAMSLDDEIILIWSFPTWLIWADFERAADDRSTGIGAWPSLNASIVGRERILMADAPLSPLRTGRQPQTSDRRSLHDL